MSGEGSLSSVNTVVRLFAPVGLLDMTAAPGTVMDRTQTTDSTLVLPPSEPTPEKSSIVGHA